MHLVKHLGIGLCATALLLLGKIAFERTAAGHDFEVKTYEVLQSFLPSLSGSPLPVLVADISKLPGGKDGPTPREELKKLLAALVAQYPRAIALDIDFSPDEGGWMTPRDPEFFDYCLELSRRTRTPIFLGVFRTVAEGPDTWLGLSKYRSLAAAGLAKPTDTRRLPRWIQFRAGAPRLPTLGEALARAYRADPPPPPRWISWAVERTEHEPAEGLSTADVLVNYSKLEQLKSEHVVFTRPDTVEDMGALLRGRLVLLGDVAMPMDPFVVPGQAASVPGVYLMASVAYTIAFEPLFEFTHTVRLVLDFAISLVIVSGAYWISTRTTNVAASRRRRGRFIIVIVAGVLLAGIALVRFADIMWLDFMLAPGAILLHPRVEDWIATKLKPQRKAHHGSGA